MLNCSVFIFYSTQKLRPRGLELQQGELGDLVEQEMAATSAAVESAAARIEVCECVCMRVYSCPYSQYDIKVCLLCLGANRTC